MTLPARAEFVDSLIEKMRTDHGEEAAAIAGQLVEWAESRGLRLTHDERQHVLTPALPHVSNGTPFTLFPETPRVDVQLGFLRQVRPMDMERRQEELRERLSEIDGFDVEKNPWFPNIALSDLGRGDALDRFLDAMDWVVERIRRLN